MTKMVGSFEKYMEIKDKVGEIEDILDVVGHIIDDMCYFGWSGEDRQLELKEYEEINKKVKELRSLLNDVTK